VTDRGGLGGELGLEAFGTACGLAIIAGGLAVLLPSFDILTATLVALGVAGWASIHRRGNGGGARPSGTHLLGFALLGAAVVNFFDPPGALGPWRALLLGLGLVPLWVVERSRPVPRPLPRSET